MMSLVRVDRLCFVKAREAAFLSRADAAIHPNIAGFSEALKFVLVKKNQCLIYRKKVRAEADKGVI